MHEWNRNIRKFYSKQPDKKVQIYYKHGAPLFPHQEFVALIDHFNTLFRDDVFHTHTPLLRRWPFSQADIETGLSQLPIIKALAPDGFQAVVWQYFAEDIIFPAIEYAWTQQIGTPPAHWSTGWLHLFNKSNKPPNTAVALRPICLQHIINKALTGIHCAQIMDHVFPRLRSAPLYAYLPNRDIKDYLLLISDHCRQVKALCQLHHRDPVTPGLRGGTQVSLNLEKSFDAIDRNLVVRALSLYDLDPNLRFFVHSWFQPYEYCISHKEIVGRFVATRGIKQGSKDAPMLWTLSMYLFLRDLLIYYDLQWITSHIIICADYINLRWIINSQSSDYAALHDLAFVLGTLKAFHFRVSVTKNGTIMRLVGKTAQAFLKRWTSRSKEGPKLHLPDI